jgi:hypothetical protein
VLKQKNKKYVPVEEYQQSAILRLVCALAESNSNKVKKKLDDIV